MSASYSEGDEPSNTRCAVLIAAWLTLCAAFWAPFVIAASIAL